MTETKVKKSIMSAKSQLEAVKDATASVNDALSSLQLLLKDDDDSMDLLRKQITHMEGKRKREILKRHKTFCRIWNPEGVARRIKSGINGRLFSTGFPI